MEIESIRQIKDVGEVVCGQVKSGVLRVERLVTLGPNGDIA